MAEVAAYAADGAVAPPWPWEQRTVIPERPPDYLNRPSLAERCQPTDRSLTLLVAPGGFGKTALLGESCRDAIGRGVPAAWLSLHPGDDADALDECLAHACRKAGLDFVKPRPAAEPSSAPHPSTALALQAVERLGGPFVLALDEAEHLREPDAVDWLNALLDTAPANLHVAIAARELPPGIDVLSPRQPQGSAILTADDLRFDARDIDRYFDGQLSRRALESLLSASWGWPMALRICLSEQRADSEAQAHVIRDMTGNWIKARLFRGLHESDWQLLLDVGLFSWFDAPLLDAALGTNNAMARLRAMRPLGALLEQVGGSPNPAWRLHPLIREHSAAWQQRTALTRYRAVNAAIASALAARGPNLEAMRHAARADDAVLLANTLIDAGGVRNSLREGVDHLARAVGLVPEQAFEAHFDSEAARSDETRSLLRLVLRYAGGPGADPAARLGVEFMLCALSNLRADFGEAVDRGRSIRDLIPGHAPALASAVDLQLGLAAMAQGRAGEALARYQSAGTLGTSATGAAPDLTGLADLLIQELNLERNLVEAGTVAHPLPKDSHSGTDLTAHFAASDIAVELALDAKGVDEALSRVDRALAHARHANLPGLARHLAAVRVSLLIEAGRIEEAERAWEAGELPATDPACIDLDKQSWRELESIASARLRLLTAKRAFRDGRRFAGLVLDVAGQRRLRRTELRIRVLVLKLERHTGSAGRPALEPILELVSETGYMRPLLREGSLAEAVLQRYLADHCEGPHRTVAQALLAAAKAGSANTAPRLTRRESEVLLRLKDRRDDDIAAELRISHHGVRFHVQNIFRKLDVRTRRQAVRRAESLGLVPAPDAGLPARPARAG